MPVKLGAVSQMIMSQTLNISETIFASYAHLQNKKLFDFFKIFKKKSSAERHYFLVLEDDTKVEFERFTK